MKEKLPRLAAIYLLVFSLLPALILGGSRLAAVLGPAAAESPTVVIDAGHGGIDGGATSCTGAAESAINLEIALRLEALLRLLGIRTRMVRTTDVSVATEGATIAAQKSSDLKERVRIANEASSGLLVSIHQNRFSDGRYSGAQVFYASTPGSQALAEQLQAMLVSTLNPGSRRKAKKASGVYLMEHLKGTGILVECGFLSNPNEEARLRTADYQKRLCCVFAAAVGNFLANT